MTAARPVLVAQEALLFLTALDTPPGAAEQLLAETLARLAVQAQRQRVVALQDTPLLGRRFEVRVTPCLVLDTGTRRVRLFGDPATWRGDALEKALTRQ